MKKSGLQKRVLEDKPEEKSEQDLFKMLFEEIQNLKKSLLRNGKGAEQISKEIMVRINIYFINIFKIKLEEELRENFRENMAPSASFKSGRHFLLLKFRFFLELCMKVCKEYYGEELVNPEVADIVRKKVSIKNIIIN